jgi:hypothetical protein
LRQYRELLSAFCRLDQRSDPVAIPHHAGDHAIKRLGKLSLKQLKLIRADSFLGAITIELLSGLAPIGDPVVAIPQNDGVCVGKISDRFLLGWICSTSLGERGRTWD